MVEVSQQAAAVLFESLQASGLSPDEGLRLTEDADVFRLERDKPTPNDHVITHNGATVLIIAADVEQRLGEAVVDIIESEEGNRLAIRRFAED